MFICQDCNNVCRLHSTKWPLLVCFLQVVFVSSCNSVWDCGSVALDDISLSQGDCELTEGREHGQPLIHPAPVLEP